MISFHPRLIEHLPCVSFTLNIKTRFDSSAAAGSRVATMRRRLTAHVQAGHVVTMCTLTLHFLCISSLDNRGWTVLEHDIYPVHMCKG